MSTARSEETVRGGWVPTVSQPSWWERLWRPFWAVPVAVSVAAVALGVVLPLLDTVVWPWVPMVFHGGPEGARSVLGTITSAMISVTGLVFSITMVVLQLAGSQFTPRVLGTFLDSRITQWTLGVFVGTFLYSLTVLRSVRDPGAADGGFVPQLGTSAAYVFVIASVAFFLAFIHHITDSIQVAAVIRRTVEATSRTADRMIPQDTAGTATRGEPPRWVRGDGDELRRVCWDGDPGHVTAMDYRKIVAEAREHDVVVEMTSRIGEYVVPGAVVAQVWGRGDGLDEAAESVTDLVTVEPERSLTQDVGFGVRQLVDIGERALSPGVNDPTTATQAVDGLFTVLRPLVQRAVPSGHVTDEDGAVRLVYAPQTVEEHLTLAVREIAYWGRDSLQVPPRLRAMLADLEEVARPEYVGTLHELRRCVDRWDEHS